MQTKRLLVCISFLLLLIGTFGVLRSASVVLPPTPKIQDKYPALKAVFEQTRHLFESGRFVEAAKIYEALYQSARRQNDSPTALRALNNLAGCWFALFRYRRAANSYLEARQLAEEQRDWEAVGTLSLNLSSLYLQMGEINSAEQAAEQSAEALAKAPKHERRAQLLLQFAKIRARKGDIDGAAPYFRAAAAEADRQGNAALTAQAWNLFGYELLSAGRIAEAEAPLIEAFRLRKLSRDPDIDHSYRTLGMLRLAQGDLRSASALLDEAVGMAKARPAKVTGWSAYYLRGQVRMAEGNAAAALDDFRSGIELARRLRVEVLPADAMRIGMEVEMQQLYSAFVRTAVQMYKTTGRRELASEAFEAAEENRAASLRALVSGADGWQSVLPLEYGELVRRLREAEAREALRPGPAAKAAVERIEHALTEMEVKAGLDAGSGSGAAGNGRGLLGVVQQRLGPGQALFSFQLGEPESYVWEVTQTGLELRAAPGRGRLAEQVEEFVRLVRGNSAGAAEMGARLYAELFGGRSRAARGSAEWVLSLDDTLFRMPFAALVEGFEGGRPVYAVERHSLRVTPSAHLLAAAPDVRPATRFIGVGDPVYNGADPRAPGGAKRSDFELQRLVGTGREIESCARVWMPGGQAILLRGTEATAEAVQRALPGSPAVLHLATHVVPSNAGQGMLALALRNDGRPELVSPAEIARWRADLRLVVLSACSSGSGKALAGTGLMGMTRAWLAVGASAVAASYWPTPDDSGEFFLSFYKALRGNAGRRPAEALQQAQVEALHSGGPRSEPGRWAAYFLVGKE
jgi:tetratricopeptide (TPR) repeat protein